MKPDVSDDKYGQTKVRMAAMLALVGPLTQYVMFLAEGVVHKAWQGELGAYFVGPAVFVLGCLLVSAVVGWFAAYPLLKLVAVAVWLPVRRRVPRRQWLDGTIRALWIWPYAAAAGSVVWSMYVVGRFGGWPADVVFGALGNLCGACCYVPLLWVWGGMIRRPVARA